MLLIYLIAGPRIYAENFIKVGRPISQEALKTFTESDQIRCSVDNMTLTTLKGNSVVDLWGWAFFLDDADQTHFERYISLTSDKMTYYYPLETVKRQDVEDYFKDLEIDVSQSGFSAYISKEFIKTGSYNITILFWDQLSNDVYRQSTNATLIRTPNKLTLMKNNGE